MLRLPEIERNAILSEFEVLSPNLCYCRLGAIAESRAMLFLPEDGKLKDYPMKDRGELPFICCEGILCCKCFEPFP